MKTCTALKTGLVGVTAAAFVALSGTALGAGMNDLTHLGCWLDDEVTLGTGGKNFFDDFTFHVVPEPAGAAWLGLGAIELVGRGRMHG